MNTSTRKALTGLGMGAGFIVSYNLAKNIARKISFKGRVVLISGGSRGLGLVLAKEFAKNGASVALLARDEEELHRAQNIVQFAATDAQVMTLPCDSREREQVRKAVNQVVEQWGRLDIVVNCAGIIATAPLENTTEEDFSDSIDTHFWAAYNVVEESLPFLKTTRGARIINIGSIGGLIPVPHLAAYCAGKFALEGYSKTLRAELMKYGIHVTTVSPGLMRTGSAGQATFKGQARKEYTWFSISSSLPLLTISAENAAKKIVRACKYGKAELVLTWPAKTAAQFKSLFPEMFADILSFVNVLLPSPGEDSELKVKGKDAHTRLSPSIVTRLSEKAAERNNEQSL